MEFCLASDRRVLLGPLKYNKARFAAALSHHGIPADLLPESAPAEPVELHQLRLLPVTDTTEQPDRPEFYHVGQPELTVYAGHVERNQPLTPYPLEYCSQLMIEKINGVADNVHAMLKKGKSDLETDSWPDQKSEAMAWKQDNTVAISTLTRIAAKRGMLNSDLVDLVLKKAAIYSDYVGLVLGDAQVAEQEIEALKQLDSDGDLPTDWFEQLMVIADGWRKDWPVELLTLIGPSPTA